MGEEAVKKSPRVSFDDAYFESLLRLEAVDQRRLNEALVKFKNDPLAPGLNLEHLDGNLSHLMSVRAGQDLRVILYKEHNTYVWWFADHHDAAYKRAGRARFVINPNTSFIGFVERSLEVDSSPDEATPRGAPESGKDNRVRPFDHWRDDELTEAGFTAEEVAGLRELLVEEELLDLETSGWGETRISLAIDLMGYTPEQWATRGDARDEAIAREDRLQDAIARFGALAGLSPLFSDEELERIAAAPIEDRMLFLHPDQRALVDRVFSGPARVRGAAGTGKTVVVLHRAAELANRYSDEGGRILVTTYIRSLPPVFSELHRRLPGADPTRIDFLNVDKLANRICAEAGNRPMIDPQAVERAFASAWRKLVAPSSPVHLAGLTRGYVQDEIRFVIKGRGIRELDHYLNLKRTGRRTQFGEQIRHQVWELKEAWDERLAVSGTEDFYDVVLRARDLARMRVTPTYRAALIDEAQDLTLVGLQLIRSLVNGAGADQPDGLFIAGDGAQRIYTGGFTLRQAGIEVRGRTSVLRVNYRNTTSVYAAAVGVAGEGRVEDLDEDYVRGEEPAEVSRQGAPVELLVGTSFEDEISLIAKRANEVVASGQGISLGDLAVCCSTNQQAKVAITALKACGLPIQELEKYEGTPNGLLKVGTHHRVKGLEFKVVFLPGLSDGEFPRPAAPGRDPKEQEDQVALSMSALFVAMTRARDVLVLTCTNSPAEVLEPILEQLQCQGT